MLADMNILLVDDDETVCSSMAYFFKNKSQSFQTAESAEEALAYLEAGNRPDIVISDYQLPGMNGLAFLECVKNAMPGVLTALITAHGRLELAIEAVRIGVQDFIQKPFNGNTIRNALEVMVKRTRESTAEPHVNGRKISEADDDQWRRNADFIINKVCHQINNTLQSLQASAEIGLFAIGDDHPVAAKLRDVLFNVERVHRINNELKSLGDLIAVETPISTEINTLIDSCFRALKGNIAKQRILITQRCQATQGVSVSIKAEVMLHILDNLVINAIQAVAVCGRPEKRVTVSTEIGDDTIQLQIEDNGVGMDGGTLAKAREKGFTTKPQGTGLGLFIVERLCKEIGATLSLTSKPGTGTQATLSIPA